MTKYTRAADNALAKVVRHLDKEFKDALRRMTKPGQSRTWYMRYLSEVYAKYRWLCVTRVQGKKLYERLPGKRRQRIAELIKQSSNRDRRTVSRWAKVISEAKDAKVRPKRFVKWLKEGGGVAGVSGSSGSAKASPKRHRKQADQKTSSAVSSNW